MAIVGLENLALLLVLSVLFIPFIVVIGVLVLVMTCSWSKNARKFYVNMLLKIFKVSHVALL